MTGLRIRRKVRDLAAFSISVVTEVMGVGGCRGRIQGVEKELRAISCKKVSKMLEELQSELKEVRERVFKKEGQQCQML